MALSETVAMLITLFAKEIVVRSTYPHKRLKCESPLSFYFMHFFFYCFIPATEKRKDHIRIHFQASQVYPAVAPPPLTTLWSSAGSSADQEAVVVRTARAPPPPLLEQGRDVNMGHRSCDTCAGVPDHT